MYDYEPIEDFGEADYSDRPRVKAAVREEPPPLRPKPIPAGTTVALSKLLARGWSYSEIDTAVADGVLIHCGGKSAYVTNKELY